MKKELIKCDDCGDTKSILTQVSCTVDITYLCNSCYNLKFSKEVQEEIEKENILIPDFIKN